MDGKTTLPWIRDDGGRATAGFKGTTSDCVTRAIAIAAERPYQQVYDELNALCAAQRAKPGRSKTSARTGVPKPVIRRYLDSIGWRWVPTMAIGSGCTTHLCAEELPMGRLIVSLSKHLTCVVDHTIRDAFDPQRISIETRPGQDARLIRRCVYGYWRNH